MEAHAHFGQFRGHVPHLRAVRREAGGRTLTVPAIGVGVVGLIVLGAPLVIYDWANASHSALELPMAVTGWLFGLDHFARNGYHWWPIVIGALFLLGYWAIQGAAFAGLARNVYRTRTLAASLALGAGWSLASFMLFWYMVLPIARGGAPFRLTASGSTAFVAPNWVWILAFALSGLAMGIAYRLLGVRAGAVAADSSARPERQVA